MHALLVSLTLIGMAIIGPASAAQGVVELSVDVSKTGAKIDRNIFGQFAEHLGHGIYDGTDQAGASQTNTTGAAELAVRDW